MSEIKFNDQFSKMAAAYLRYRPRYPSELFAWLASLCHSQKRAWDAATGNGQSALSLVEHFTQVVATDASADQIANAKAHERIVYKIAPSEKTDIASHSIDLITVAQALHWFNLDEFYREARRVLKRDGIIAAWTYRFVEVEDEIDRLLMEFHEVVVKPFWLPENNLTDNEFFSMPFPFREIRPPQFEMKARWTLDHLKGFLGTWSAVERFKEQRGSDPVESIAEDLKHSWGDPRIEKAIRWPIKLRVGLSDE